MELIKHAPKSSTKKFFLSCSFVFFVYFKLLHYVMVLYMVVSNDIKGAPILLLEKRELTRANQITVLDNCILSKTGEIKIGKKPLGVGVRCVHFGACSVPF
jgi:hypothetical protein